jgi:hypothetical protein
MVWLHLKMTSLSLLACCTRGGLASSKKAHYLDTGYDLFHRIKHEIQYSFQDSLLVVNSTSVLEPMGAAAR